MRKLALQLSLVLAVVASATASHANIFVKITDGTTTLDGTTLNQSCVPLSSFPNGCSLSQAPGFVVNQATDATSPANAGLDVTDTMVLLKCPTHPCTVFFPSGALTPQPGDTFKFADTNPTGPFARVVMFDSATSADRVSLRGIAITSLTAGKTLTLTYGTQVGDLRAQNFTPYPATAAMSGTFRTALGSRATACSDGSTSTSVGTPCVELLIKVNGTTVDGQGSSAVATTAVPCNNSFPTVNPCGTGGSWSTTGSFSGVNDTNNMDCPSTCTPTSRGILTVVFKGASETLNLAASAHGAISSKSAQDGGLEENFLALADELGGNRWVPYTAANQRCQAVPKAPSTNDTRNINNNSNLPLSFELWCGFFAPLTSGTGVSLLSIVDQAESNLIGNLTGSQKPTSQTTQNDASRVGFLPAAGQLAVKGITVLSLTYDVFVGTGPSGNSSLGNLNFTDCTAGSLRVEFQLLDSKTRAPVGTANVYLGSNSADHFQSLCNGFESTIGTDLVNNPDARVDTSGLAGNLASPCCITFKKFQQGSTGQLLVRKMSLIVDHGIGVPLTPCSPSDTSACANHMVTFFDGNVNGFTALSSLQIVTGVTRTFDLSTDGVNIMITKLSDPTAPASYQATLPKIVTIVPSTDITINGGKYTSSVNVNALEPNSGATYAVSLCPNGSAIDPILNPLQDTSGAWRPQGICIPDQAIFTLL